jgi:hypothetical protein
MESCIYCDTCQKQNQFYPEDGWIYLPGIPGSCCSCRIRATFCQEEPVIPGSTGTSKSGTTLKTCGAGEFFANMAFFGQTVCCLDYDQGRAGTAEQDPTLRATAVARRDTTCYNAATP